MWQPDIVPPTTPITPSTMEGCLLEVTVTAADATNATVRVQGEMDLATAELVTAALDSQLTAGRRFVRLDLSALRFLDGTGLDVLVRAHNRFLAERGSLVLTGVGTRVARLLSITHLDEALLVADRPGQVGRGGPYSALPPASAQ
ncbi:MAG TPA: STAS domain-containing protein [Jatrophihabitans sp.]|nr:STAS domain-containing protein [Jatrophihabitans sp.]